MPGLIIVEYILDENNNITYDKIVDLLVGVQKVRTKYSNIDVWCKIDKKILDIHHDIRRLLGNVYDRVLLKDNFKDINKYDYVKHIKLTDIGNTYDLNTDYEYDQLKKLLGNNIQNNFIFKERDLQIQQRGGFNFKKKKIIYNNDPKINIISKLYKIDKNINHIQYYHISKNIQYRPYNVKVMFENIDEFDFILPIKKLIEYHSENSYYQKLYDRNKKYIEKKELMNEINEDDKDSIILQYIKCRSNTFSITLWNPALNSLNKFIDILKESGNVYYIKKISLNKNGMRNLLFWYYDDFTYNERLIFIEKKMSYINVSENNNEFYFILFDNIHNKELSGQGSKFKKYLREKLMELIQSDKYRGNDLLHINDYFYQTVEYSELLLNKNSIEHLNLQDCRYFNNDNFITSNLKMQTLRRILYSEMSLLEIDRFLIIGGITLYSYGIRAFNDMDGLIIDILPNTSKHLVDFINNVFSNKKTKIHFIDAFEQSSSFWNDSWNKKDYDIFKILKINDYKDLTLDPANFFYHQGIKIVKLDFEMFRKLIRNRTEDHTDFLMINLLFPDIIKNYIKINDNYSKDSNNNFFIVNKKYENIIGKYDNRFLNKRMEFINRRYSTEQIDSVKNLKIFKDFLVH